MRARLESIVFVEAYVGFDVYDRALPLLDPLSTLPCLNQCGTLLRGRLKLVSWPSRRASLMVRDSQRSRDEGLSIRRKSTFLAQRKYQSLSKPWTSSLSFVDASIDESRQWNITPPH